MNPDSTLAVTNTCPKDGVHLSCKVAQVAAQRPRSGRFERLTAKAPGFAGGYLHSPPAAQGDALRLWIGGPVEPQRGWILLREQPADADAVRVCEGVYLSTSADLLRRLLAASPASDARLLTGYAGWGPGQLDAELSASAWLMADVDVDIVFQTAPDRMWEAAIRRLGADPSSLQMSHGVH